MKYLLALCSILLLLSFTDKGRHWYNSTLYRCNYKTEQGRFDGEYTSYYPNGRKKAQGFFNNNYRTGKWSVWNNRGELLLERYYNNPFQFTGVYPEITKKHASSYVPLRDNNGCYRHLFFTEASVIAANRNWRFIEPTFNPLLFENNRLYRITQSAVINKQVLAFASDSCASLCSFSGMDTSKLRIVGFRSMEDWIIDSSRLVLEYYTIAICPVAVHPATGDTLNLYWIKLDDLRPYLPHIPKTDLLALSQAKIDAPVEVRNSKHIWRMAICSSMDTEAKPHPLNPQTPRNYRWHQSARA
ncbi:MAG: hypothetical protein V4658_13970 [Bacteroidota bacterium]